MESRRVRSQSVTGPRSSAVDSEEEDRRSCQHDWGYSACQRALLQVAVQSPFCVVSLTPRVQAGLREGSE